MQKDLENLQISDFLIDEMNKQGIEYDKLVTLAPANQKQLNHFILLVIKYKAYKQIICIAGQDICSTLYQEFKNAKLEKAGMVFIAMDKGCSEISVIGSFCITNEFSNPLWSVET